MSYCRKNADSDVYMYPVTDLTTGASFIVCAECCLSWGDKDWEIDTEKEALDHLKLHRSAGHKVPQEAINRLIEETEARGEVMEKDVMNRLLVEAQQGGCWHEWDNPMSKVCNKCHELVRPFNYTLVKSNNPDYTIDVFFFPLFRWAMQESHPRAEVTCWECGGSGKEICDNPDHGFIEAMPGDISRIGCPCCGHDPNHIIKNSTCPTCSGKGTVWLREWKADEFGLWPGNNGCKGFYRDRNQDEKQWHFYWHSDLIGPPFAPILAEWLTSLMEK